jgi:hypothetical protein
MKQHDWVKIVGQIRKIDHTTHWTYVTTFTVTAYRMLFMALK